MAVTAPSRAAPPQGARERPAPAACNAVISIEVTNASHFTADTYRLQLAIAGLPGTFSPAYWAESQDDLVQLSVVMDGAEQQLITGQVDDAELDLVARTITLTGRDLSSRFLDSKTAEKFQNQTASQIATTLAARHGLTADVTPLTTKAGTYYEIDHAVLTREQTEWDLLVYLAEREGFDVWVTGTTLHFKPSEAMDAPYLLVWSEPNSIDGNTFASNALDIRSSGRRRWPRTSSSSSGAGTRSSRRGSPSRRAPRRRKASGGAARPRPTSSSGPT